MNITREQFFYAKLDYTNGTGRNLSNYGRTDTIQTKRSYSFPGVQKYSFLSDFSVTNSGYMLTPSTETSFGFVNVVSLQFPNQYFGSNSNTSAKTSLT